MFLAYDCYGFACCDIEDTREMVTYPGNPDSEAVKGFLFGFTRVEMRHAAAGFFDAWGDGGRGGAL